MMVAFYVGVIALVAARRAAVAGAAHPGRLPLLVRVLRGFNQPKPTEPPPDNPVWPLWWAPLAFVHTRRAGGLLILGLLAWALDRRPLSERAPLLSWQATRRSCGLFRVLTRKSPQDLV